MKKIKQLLGFDDPTMGLENKLFNAVALIIGLFMFLSLIDNIVLGFSIYLDILILMATVLSAVAFYQSRFLGYKENTVIIYVSVGIALFIPGWFYNGGIEGSTPQEGVFLVALIIILVHPRYHLAFIGICMAVFLSCFITEKYHPEWVTHPKSIAAKEMDLLLSSLLDIFIIGLLVGVLKKSHETDKETLVMQSEELKTSEAALSKAKDQAEAATFAKSNFLANMSHEIRTPLNGIIGTGELLARSPLNAEQKELLHTLQASSNMLLNIISDILDLSKIEADKLVLSPAPFNIRECIKNVMGICQPVIDSAGKPITLNLYVDPKLAQFVNSDDSRLKQILVNLIGNAIKFTIEGYVKLDVVVTESTSEMQQVTFRIIDSGIGIGPEALDELFKPFMQVNDTNARKFGGTGLGLSICKKLVEMMSGRIWAESAIGRGSVFSFTVPLRVAETILTQDQIPAAEAPAKPHKLRILLAEDNKMNQLVAKRIFENIGYPIDFADNGALALMRLEQQNYDLIFMDIQMPEMDGLQATKHIIRRYGEKAPPIIAMTANVLSEMEQECRQAGMKDFMSKPFTIDRLEAVINKWAYLQETA